MTPEEYADLQTLARRYSRVEHETNDLLQEALIIAISANRYDFSVSKNRAWIHGVLRNLARQKARSAVRQKQRDGNYSAHNEHEAVQPSDILDLDANNPTRQFMHRLSPASRTVAVLILHGLNRAEITALLDLSTTAFRQRLRTIRKALAPLPAATRQEIMATAYASRHGQNTQLPLGLIRTALLMRLDQELEQGNRALGTHDPSGHPIVIRTQKK